MEKNEFVYNKSMLHYCAKCNKYFSHGFLIKLREKKLKNKKLDDPNSINNISRYLHCLKCGEIFDYVITNSVSSITKSEEIYYDYYYIVINYINNLMEKLYYNGNNIFWVFLDTKFSPIKHNDFVNMTNLIPKYLYKYKDRQISEVRFLPYHKENTKKDKKSMCKNEEIVFRLKIITYIINDKGEITNNIVKNKSCSIMWYIEDFNITKPTFKFIKALINILDNSNINLKLYGVSVLHLINILKKNEIFIDDVLTPIEDF